MTVLQQSSTSVESASAPSITPKTSIHIRTDPYCGRKYHASAALDEDADLLGAQTPFSYTIWKRFRNEVCAECWRYDQGRRSFLTRRDDEGLEDIKGRIGSGSQDGLHQKNTNGRAKEASTIGAGLWFCNEQCQLQWITREGIEAVDLLKRLEAARQKKPPKPEAAQREGTESKITQETVNQAWDDVRAKEERSPKEVQRWRDIQLDDYETDMARYVLLALLRCHRERTRGPATSDDTTAGDKLKCPLASSGGDARRESWATFASLQANELPLLHVCPEILEHQTRIYRLLRGRFGAGAHAAKDRRAPSRSSPSSAPSPNSGALPSVADEPHPETGGGIAGAVNMEQPGQLSDVVTAVNVRTALGVDPGNSFGIWEAPLMEESECLGFAVYPSASFFNHHCSPNVRKEREGRTLRFVTTKEIDCGEELCISYGHVEGMSLEERQKELEEGWYFRCRCSRCVVEGQVKREE